MNFRQYRKFERGEFIIVGGDCSQGGSDYNACQFLSKTKLDVPLIYHSRGVAADMTIRIFPVLEEIFDQTGVKPMVALERNNGGASEMSRLAALNRMDKYKLYTMKQFGVVNPQDTDKYGYITSSATRPQMLGDLKSMIDSRAFNIYDEPTINEMFSFIINKNGKPEAESGAHDDLIMSLAIAVQLYQTESPTATAQSINQILDELPVEPWKNRDFY